MKQKKKSDRKKSELIRLFPAAQMETLSLEIKSLDKSDEYDQNSHIKGRLGEAMKTVAISKLKAHLSDFLNQVKAGSEVLITDRGKPVGRLVPLSRAQTPRDSLARMEKQALIKLGSGKLPKDFWKMPRAKDPQGLVLRALLEEREAGR
jgi:prevent-host-death family protein